MQTIPLFPLGNTLFPDGVLALQVFEIRYLDLIRKCMADDSEFGIVALLKGSEVRKPEGGEVLTDIGTMARITHAQAPMPSLLRLHCVGKRRFRLHNTEQRQYGLWVGQAELLPEDPPVDIPDDLQHTANVLGKLIAGWQQEGIPAEAMPVGAPYRLDEAGWVANRWSDLLPLTIPDKVALLAENDPLTRLRQVHEMLDARGLLPDA